ncbi:MAG: glycosyltransferase family 1 protein [Bacillota bacterium]
MRVLMDLHQNVLQNKDGIAAYSLGLIRAFADTDKGVEVLGLVNPPVPEEVRKMGPAFRVLEGHIRTDSPKNMQWMTRVPFTVYHLAKNGLGVCRNHPAMVATIFDMIPFTHPELVDAAYRRHITSYITKVLDHCKAIITLSRQSKRLITELSGYPADRIFLAPPGAPTAMPRLQAPYRFILYVGGFNWRKNVPNLIRAYALLVRRGFGHKLVVLGERVRAYSQAAALVQELGLQDKVLCPGYVSELTLRKLYAKADLVVYPSLAEGFGLPVLEAMTHGVPCVASRLPELEEIGGGACMYFDPTNVESIADTMALVLGDPSTGAKMVYTGRARALAYTWSNTVEQTVAAYRLAAGGR